MHATWFKSTWHLRKFFFLVFFSFCALYSSPSYADMSVRAYQQNVRDSSKVGMTQFYLEAVGTGITWTNSALVAKVGNGLFCTPRKFKLTGQLASKLIDNALQNASAYDIRSNDSISYVLLIALTNTYRC